MSSGTNVFGSSCANRTRYSTPPACSNAIWIASRMDWFTLFGVPFARPPQRVPFGGLGGIAGPGGVGAASEPGGAVATEAKSGRHWTFDVIPLFRHYFSGNSSLNLRSFPTNQALRGSSPPCPLGGVASKPPLLFVAETRGGALARPATIPRARFAATEQKANSYHSVRGAAPQHGCVRVPGPGELIRGRALDCLGERFSALRDGTARARGAETERKANSPLLPFDFCAATEAQKNRGRRANGVRCND
jgi:hypothetical protein